MFGALWQNCSCPLLLCCCIRYFLIYVCFYFTFLNLHLLVYVWCVHCVVFIQAVPWGLTLKLMAQINLNHLRLRQKISLIMMTSQDHICVRCVTNGLQRKISWRLTDEYTLKKTCIHAAYVREVLCPGVNWHVTRIFTLVHSGAQNVINALQDIETYQNTDEFILWIIHLNVAFVANYLQHLRISLDTEIFTVERNRTNVTCVTRHLETLEI